MSFELEKIPRALVLTGYGINCDYETWHCLKYTGADAHRVHLNDLISGHKSLEDYHILVVPGGFSFGDDISSGIVFANKLRFHLGDSLERFIDDGKLILGICNGFQVLVKLGLLPALGGDYWNQTVSLTYNDSGRFEDRWVHLKVNENTCCIYLKGLERLYLPVRHGEGKFITDSREILHRILSGRQLAVTYTDRNGNPALYPDNPNGSMGDIAGICDPTGRIFGLMPHPEAYNHRTNHPHWTRESLPEEGQGLAVFRNAVEFARENLL
ncbi:MAG: phosphoribosylformylglycinamidine synthase I [Candidatus Glassbacteria bacterium]